MQNLWLPSFFPCTLQIFTYFKPIIKYSQTDTTYWDPTLSPFCSSNTHTYTLTRTLTLCLSISQRSQTDQLIPAHLPYLSKSHTITRFSRVTMTTMNETTLHFSHYQTVPCSQDPLCSNLCNRRSGDRKNAYTLWEHRPPLITHWCTHKHTHIYRSKTTEFDNTTMNDVCLWEFPYTSSVLCWVQLVWWII